MFNEKEVNLISIISIISIIIIILVPIYVIDGLYTVHHVSNGMLYDAIKIASTGKLPNEGFPAITPIPYLHATILYIITNFQILQLNITYLILFQLIIGIFLLILLDRIKNVNNNFIKKAFMLKFIIIITLMLLYWNIYPSDIYEYGFHHQWYGVFLVAFVIIFLSRYSFRNWGIFFITLFPFLISIPFVHPFAELILLLYLMIALIIILLGYIISKIRFVRIAPLIYLLVLSIIVIYLNDTLISLTLKQYIPLFFEKIKIFSNEIQKYLSIVISPPVQNPLIILSSVVFKYFVFALNVIFPYMMLLVHKYNRGILYKDLYLISALAFSLSLMLYPIVNIVLRYFSFAFVQRYLYFLFILIILNGMLFINNSGIRIKKINKLGKIIDYIMLMLLIILMLGLFSTLVVLPLRVPLVLFYSAYRPQVINLNLYLANLSFAATVTPGYYIMPQYLNNSITEIALYTYSPSDAIKELFKVIIIIWDEPCQGIYYQLLSAGLHDINCQNLFMSLMHNHDLIYNNGWLKVLIRVS